VYFDRFSEQFISIEYNSCTTNLTSVQGAIGDVVNMIFASMTTPAAVCQYNLVI